MRVEIRSGGGGVPCWNQEAIQSYADATNNTESRLTQRNPDLVVIEGRVKCYGCELQEYHYAMKCTAELTKTLYAVTDQIKPRAADAAGQHREIPGLATTRPESAADSAEQGDHQVTTHPADSQPIPEPVAAAPHRVSGLRGLFGRGS